MAKETRKGFGKGVEDDGAVIDQSPEESEESLAKKFLLLIQELGKEKKRAEMLSQRTEEQKRKYWWENPIENITLEQVQKHLRVYLILRAAKEMEREIIGVPKAMDLPQKASIPYTSKTFWPVEDEASSSASSYDSVNYLGTNVEDVVQGGGSSMSDSANAVGSSKMKAKIDG